MRLFSSAAPVPLIIQLDSHKARDLKPRLTTASREAPSPAQDEVLTELAGVGVIGPPRYRPPRVTAGTNAD